MMAILLHPVLSSTGRGSGSESPGDQAGQAAGYVIPPGPGAQWRLSRIELFASAGNRCPGRPRPSVALPLVRTRRFTPTREWEDARQIRGLEGEYAAIAYLTACGWSIEAHRFRLGRHDIDLIARRGGVVAFVEVKTRRGQAFGSPGAAVGRDKQAAIARVAEIWRLRNGRAGEMYRFDVIEVLEGRNGSVRIEHLEDAWRLSR